jgi:hypothetical protein
MLKFIKPYGYKGWKIGEKFFRKDRHSWQLGTWSTPVSARWMRRTILRRYGVESTCKFSTICFGRLEIRIWKPKIMRHPVQLFIIKDMRKAG